MLLPVRIPISLFFLLGGLLACTNGRFQSASGNGGGGNPLAAGFPNSTVWAIAVNSANGDVYVGGQFTQVGSQTANRVARYFSDGRLDADFPEGTGFDGIVHALLLTNNQLYVGGDFTAYNGQGGAGLVRLELDGAYDATFNAAERDFDDAVIRIEPSVAPADRLHVGGAFVQFGPTPSLRMARLHTTGVIDTGFSLPGTGFSGIVRDFAQLPAAPFAIMVGGDFGDFNSSVFSNVALITTNGSAVGTFSPAAGLNGPAYAVERFDTNTFGVFGDFSTFNATSSDNGVVLNTNGGIQIGMSGTFGGRARAVTPAVSGDYIIGGDFTAFSSFTPLRALRLNGATAIVQSFLTNDGFDAEVYAVAAAPTDEKIYFGGTFSDFKGTAVSNLARLTSEGLVDLAFPAQP